MAQLTEDQLQFGDALTALVASVRDQLEDEDPGEVDWDDVLETLASAPQAIQAIVLLLDKQETDVEIGMLVYGGAVAFLNDHIDEIQGDS